MTASVSPAAMWVRERASTSVPLWRRVWVRSARRAQPSQGDRDEPADRGLGRQAARCAQSVEAVARELVLRDIVAEDAGGCGLGQQVLNHVAELALRVGDVLVSVQERREFGVVVSASLVGDESVGVEHGFESL